jgi:hypothetical protein
VDETKINKYQYEKKYLSWKVSTSAVIPGQLKLSHGLGNFGKICSVCVYNTEFNAHVDEWIGVHIVGLIILYVYLSSFATKVY